MKVQEECALMQNALCAASGDAAELREKRTFRFERKEHLKGRKDIQTVFKQGKSYYCQGAKLLVLKNGLLINRICFTLPRGFGISVKRNRARRLGREAYRLLQPRLRSGYDFILLIFPEAQATLATRSRQLEFLFSKAGLLE